MRLNAAHSDWNEFCAWRDGHHMLTRIEVSFIWFRANSRACNNCKLCSTERQLLSLAYPQRRQKLVAQRIAAGKHIFEACHRHGLGALLAQEARERMDRRGRAVQGEHPRGGGAAERRHHAKTRLGGVEELLVAGPETAAHLAERARARLRGD